MSKVSKLKQEAYEAGKKRDWDRVVVLYERILELEKNNPALINELGDTHLRKGDIPRAIEHFLSAAEKYRATGLLNNAVAIYKKILRFDPANASAHWFLAESRCSQGLAAEGAQHALQFLAMAERIGDGFKDAYQKRCLKLLAIYAGQAPVLERLREVFNHWRLPLETARAACLLAVLMLERGEEAAAEARMEALLEAHPELVNYAECKIWRERRGLDAPAPAVADPFTPDANAVELGDRRAPAARDAHVVAAGETPAAAAGSLAQSLGLIDLDGGAAEAPGAAAGAAGGEAGTSWDDGLLRTGRARLFDVQSDGGGGGQRAQAPAAPEPGGPDPERPIDLLAEILAETAAEAAATDAAQVETIVTEIETKLGGAAPNDPESQYNMGLMYMDMGLWEQAADCFAAAAGSAPHALRAHEMWGIALVHQERYEEAVDVLGRGLRAPGAEPADLLGLLYNTGQAYERAGRKGAAREYYLRVHQLRPDFLDVEQRLEICEAV